MNAELTDPAELSAGAKHPFSLTARIIIARMRFRMGTDRAVIIRRLRRALGESYAAQEIRRLAKATYLYRAMADHDRAHAPASYRQIDSASILHLQDFARERARIAAPQDFFSEPLLREFGVMPVILPAPADSRERFAAAFEAFGNDTTPIHLVRVVRVGMQNRRLEIREFPDGAENETFIRGAMNDAMVDNPAQYDWFRAQ
ncbi:hypothetical protein IT570_06175 [Candidatus Sumerlaeota bacterium]|nr:hypothetical protein [Candidatus Sumerlaeota bacterium]